MTAEPESKLYMTQFDDYVEDRARTEGWPEGRMARVMELAATDELAGSKTYPSQKIWNATAASIVNLALQAVTHEEAVAAAPPADTPAKKELRLAAKAAFGAEPTMKARGQLRQLLILQGAAPREADEKLAEIAKGFGASLASLAPGKVTPKEFLSPKAAARLAAEEDDDAGGDDDGEEDKPKKVAAPGDVPKSKNPWSADAWSITEQGRLTRVFGIEKAAAMAASVGCKIGDTRPNPKSSAQK